MNPVLFATIPLLLLCACGPKTAPTPPAAAPAPPVSQIAITTAKFLADEITSTSGTATNPILWEISLIQVPEGKLNQFGLQSLFDLPLETNDLTAKEITFSPVSELARRATNVNLTASAGIHAGITSLSTMSNLLETFRPHADVEVTPAALSAPASGREAQYFSGAVLTVVTGIKTNTSTVTTNPTTPILNKLSLGQTVTVRSIQNGDDAILSAVARLDWFRGYPEPNAKKPQQPSPQFEVTVFGTRTALRPGEVLLLGSPPLTTTQRFSERVPRLSDIPLFGQLFVKSGAQTNRFRSLVLIRRK